MTTHNEIARRIMPSPGSEWPLSDHGYAVAVGHAIDVLRAEAPMLLSTTDLDRLRQWLDAMRDTNPAYIEDGDRVIYNRILSVLSERSNANQ